MLKAPELLRYIISAALAAGIGWQMMQDRLGGLEARASSLDNQAAERYSFVASRLDRLDNKIDKLQEDMLSILNKRTNRP